MKAKRLIEVAMPVKEVSAESVRDKYIHNGHLSTLHIWWARRPLPLCRATVFASLIPDPLDDNCPQSFKDAVEDILRDRAINKSIYRPYTDIPYTSAYDPMEDNLRNRLLMFIGKFSETCIDDMRHGRSNTPQGELLSNSSLVKWESKNKESIINIARELIWIAYNGEKDLSKTYKELHDCFEKAWNSIKVAEKQLYSTADRIIRTEDNLKKERTLSEAISSFQAKMPTVFDPFAGGAAIPFEAARLGCRSYGNDINPVAHIIEKGSAEFPQKYGKPLKLSESLFKKTYGDFGSSLSNSFVYNSFEKTYSIPNRLAFDIEYYAKCIIRDSEKEIGSIYNQLGKDDKPVAFIWGREGKCSNPSCGASFPLLKQFYLSKKSKKSIYLAPSINAKKISFSIKEGTSPYREGWVGKRSVTCPCCGAVTDIDTIKAQANVAPLKERLLAIVCEGNSGKYYKIPDDPYPSFDHYDVKYRPHIKMNKLPDLISGRGWGIEYWDQLFSHRQLAVINCLLKNYFKVKESLCDDDYNKAVITYLALWLDRVFSYSTSFARWIPQNEQLTSLFGRQAIPMILDYPEANLFATSTSGAYNQLEWIISFLNEESSSPFSCVFNNASSGERTQFERKSLSAVVTDPPYYDAIAYADLSDFFYVWLKATLGDLYPLAFSTPQTPKTEECTALKFHHNNSEDEAKQHFENKLTQIFDAIEVQTSDIVSIMFAHQSTEAWTTLCNSILSARMNISGSWAIDSERDTRMNANAGAALESSVTVACRPSERKGVGDYREVRKAIVSKVEKEVNDLYDLGFRGADLLTACFGQAVSEFGKYRIVEKADGTEVSVSELLDLARTSAFNALLKGVQGDDFSRFYIGWLQMNGMAETDFDDATKFTRVGMQVDVSEIFARRILIREGKKQHLATAAEHLGNSTTLGTRPEDSLIDQVHRAMLAYEKGDRHILLSLLHNVGAEDQSAAFWRLAASLKELLPEGNDLKAVEGLLGNSDNLRQESREVDQHKPEQMTFDFGSDFNNDFK